MAMNITLLVVPVILSPIAFVVMQMLVPTFLREASVLFTAVELPGSLARKIGTDIALHCVGIYVLCWIAAWGCHLLGWHYWATIAFAIAGVVLALLGTTMAVKKQLAIRDWSDAFFVGLVAFAGGSLPLFVLIPLLLFLINMFGQP